MAATLGAFRPSFFRSFQWKHPCRFLSTGSPAIAISAPTEPAVFILCRSVCQIFLFRLVPVWQIYIGGGPRYRRPKFCVFLSLWRPLTRVPHRQHVYVKTASHSTKYALSHEIIISAKGWARAWACRAMRLLPNRATYANMEPSPDSPDFSLSNALGRVENASLGGKLWCHLQELPRLWHGLRCVKLAELAENRVFSVLGSLGLYFLLFDTLLVNLNTLIHVI